MKLVLIRGLPGSSKSTFAEELTQYKSYSIHLEADQFFIEDGIYTWEASKVGAAHRWCQDETKLALQEKYDVVVSNTFTTISELRPYFEIARSFGIVPNVITCQNEFGNVHYVPQTTLDKMKTRFQYDISSLFKEYK